MNDLIKLIEGLANEYSEQVSIYKPVDASKIQEYEEKLGFVFPKELVLLWSHTNGLSIIDYCICGINNKIIADILEVNNPLEEFEGRFFLDFMGTSSGDDFYIELDDDNNVLGVFYSDDYFESFRMVSPTLYEFLKDFFTRIKTLLGTLESEDDIQYLDY